MALSESYYKNIAGPSPVKAISQRKKKEQYFSVVDTRIDKDRKSDHIMPV